MQRGLHSRDAYPAYFAAAIRAWKFLAELVTVKTRWRRDLTGYSPLTAE